MGIGTDTGEYHDDAFAMLAAPFNARRQSDADEMYANSKSSDFQSRFLASNVPDNSGIDPDMLRRHALGSTEKPAGALFSSGGTQTPENSQNIKIGNTGYEITPEDIDTAISVGMAAGPGTMAGVKSRTLDRAALQKAHDMVGDLAHPDDVFKETGFHVGTEGRLKYEIPDVNAKLDGPGLEHGVSEMNNDPFVSIKAGQKDAFGKLKIETVPRLENVLDHPELYKAYPFLKDIKVQPLEDAAKNQIGRYSREDNTIYMQKELYPEYARGVLLHEAQHAIQDYEGFAPGGNASYFMNKGKNWDTAMEYYKRLAGEVEARNVQTRRQMSPEELRNRPPMTTEDRPRFAQLTPDNFESRFNALNK